MVKANELIEQLKKKNGTKAGDQEVHIENIESAKVTEKKGQGSLYLAKTFPLKINVSR